MVLICSSRSGVLLLVVVADVRAPHIVESCPDRRSWSKFGEHGENGKDGKHQPDDLNY